MTDRHTVDSINSDALDALYDDLDRARQELADRDAAESADAAAGSYANGSEHAIADPARWLHIAFTSPDETTANTSALALCDHLRAEFPGVGMRVTTNATETGAPEICELPHQTIAEEDECERQRTATAPSCSPGAEETEPNNPAAEATYTTRPARVHIRTWTGHHDPDLTAWAAPAATWDGDQLVIRTGDGEARPEPGWSLVRWPDGRIIVASPWAVANCYQPLTGEAPTPRDLIDTVLRTTPRADCTDWPAREAHGHGHRYDMRCALCAGEADTLTDAVLAALQPQPGPGQPKEQP